jgi:hypothetical protein
MGKPKSQADTRKVNPAATERKINALPWEISFGLGVIRAGEWQHAPMPKEKSAEAVLVREDEGPNSTVKEQDRLIRWA